MYPKLLVIARDYLHALHYARKHDLGHPGERWRYIFEEYQIHDLRGPGQFVDLTRDDIGYPDMKKDMTTVRLLLAAGFTEVQ